MKQQLIHIYVRDKQKFYDDQAYVQIFLVENYIIKSELSLPFFVELP